MHGPDGKIPFTIGGSDVAAVFGVSPWTTPLELWRIKKGLMNPDDFANATAKEMGHLLEPIVAQCYANETGNRLIPDTGLYQHAKYPYALANLDSRMQADGEDGILECKTTTYHKAGDWDDDMIPYHYELQVRFYLAVMDLEFADICCMWGFNPENDMAIRRINRDLIIEAYIFERLDAFIASLVANQEPSMDDVKPEVAMASLARIYAKSVSGLPTVEFGTKHEKHLRQIAELQAANNAMREQIKKNESEVNAYSVQIAVLMKEHEHGIFKAPSENLLVDYATKASRRVDSNLLKSKYPVIHKEVLKISSSRKIKVTVQPT